MARFLSQLRNLLLLSASTSAMGESILALSSRTEGAEALSEPRRKQIAAVIQDQRVSAIIRTQDQRLAAEAMEAAVRGGFTLIEFTLTTPGAMELIKAFSAREALTVGAGTVLTPALAAAAVAAGARFLVSPIVDAEVIREAARLDVPVFPGANTPTEMETAHRLGADFIKVFPEPAGGVGYIRAVLAPLPHLRLFPTAGPTPENFVNYLDAGCIGVGFVRSLFVPEDLSSGNLDAVRNRAEAIIRRLADWRRSSPSIRQVP